MRICQWKTCNNVVEGRKDKIYCSQSCKNKGSVTRYRRELKTKSVEYKGGSCQICGYKKCESSLHFHHLDPTEKDFSFSKKKSLGWSVVKEELDKCVLVCSNCHGEIHAGVTKYP
jgi:5-methylcytosine-specific restriction endonuclease McrA